MKNNMNDNNAFKKMSRVVEVEYEESDENVIFGKKNKK